MKITHIITDLDLGGAERALLELMRSSHGRLQSSVICLQGRGQLADAFRQLGVPVFELGLHRRLPNPLKFFELIRAIRASQPDVVQTWMYHADVLGGLAAKLAGPAPVVWNIRNLSFDPVHPNRLTQALVRVAALISALIPAAIVTNSLAAQNEHVRLGYTKNKMHVIPNGFDLTKYAPNQTSRRETRRELGINEDTLTVGLFARFDPLKDHATFVKAATQLAAQFQNGIKFIMAGTGITADNAELYSSIEKSNARANFSLLGPRDDTPRLMNALDLLVSSSISESFPNVVGEAMATGIPCVVTDVGDSRVLVGEAGEVVQPGDAAGISAACAKILRLSPTQRAELGAKGRERIRARYDISVTVDNYLSLYSETLKSRK